nr:hypothetical protein BSM_04550 [uncultured archaeon]
MYFAENTKNFIYDLFHMDIYYGNHHTGSDNNFRSRKYSFLW